jgi:hypothetical protein
VTVRACAFVRVTAPGEPLHTCYPSLPSRAQQPDCDSMLQLRLIRDLRRRCGVAASRGASGLCGPAEAALFVALLQVGHDAVRCEALWCLANIAAGGTVDTQGVGAPVGLHGACLATPVCLCVC